MWEANYAVDTAANSVFKMSSNPFIVIAMLSSISARPAAAAGLAFFLIGENDGTLWHL